MQADARKDSRPDAGSAERERRRDRNATPLFLPGFPLSLSSHPHNGEFTHGSRLVSALCLVRSCNCSLFSSLLDIFFVNRRFRSVPTNPPEPPGSDPDLRILLSLSISNRHSFFSPPTTFDPLCSFRAPSDPSTHQPINPSTSTDSTPKSVECETVRSDRLTEFRVAGDLLFPTTTTER